MKKILIASIIITSLFSFGGPDRGFSPSNNGDGKGKFLNFNYRMVHFIPHFINFEEFDLTKEQLKELLLLNYEFMERAKKIDGQVDPLFMFDSRFKKDEYISYHTKVLSEIVTLKADIFDRILKILNDKQKKMFFSRLKNIDTDIRDKREKIDRFINGGR
jgi:hypothetical protein